jgi:dTDP-glucose pyrophosphorylase
MYIFTHSSIKEAIKVLNKYGSKTIIVINNSKKLSGTLSDGDIRKSILKGYSLEDKINKIYNKNPIFLKKNQIDIKKIKEIFIKEKIDLIPIVNSKKKIVKIFNYKDLFNFDQIDNKNLQSQNKVGVVIMAGGEGLRMQPYTKIFPKPLLPVKNDTIIDLIIENFLKFKFNNFYITTNYKYQIIDNHLKKIKFEIKYKLIKEDKKLGTAGSLEKLKNCEEDIFFVTNCDILINENYKNIIKYHQKNKNDLTIISSKKIISFPYGICEVDNKRKFLSFKEKPHYNFLINIGFYLINKKNFRFIKKNQNIDMNELILKFQKLNKRIGIYEVDYDKWKDFGNWKSYNNSIKAL